MIGERLGEWVVEAELGQGPIGRVYRVHSAEDPARVMALKWLTHPRAREPGFQQRFQGEMAVLRRLDHPNIVRYFDHGHHDGAPFFVSDWVGGPDCETLLREGKRPTWQETLAYSLSIVSALRYAHRRGVLHRGLKPSNVLLALDAGCGRQPRLTDLGMNKLFADAPGSGDNSLVAGAHLVPELAAGKPISKRSDFYSLGVTLYTLITGRQPFSGNTVVELIHKHCFVLPERPHHFVPDLPDDLDRLIMKLLAKEPAQRPGSGTLLLGELDRIWGELERRGEVGQRPSLPQLPGDVGPEPPQQAEEEDAEWLPAPAPQRISALARGLGVGALFILVVGTLIWAFFLRGPAGDELYDKGAELLRSDDPADWESAWRDYLEPYSQRHPDRHAKEVREARHRAELVAELRRAVATGRLARPESEAERFYYEGLRLCQAGSFHAARQVWENLQQAFAVDVNEQNWVRLAQLGLQRLREARDSPTTQPGATTSAQTQVSAILAEARRLRTAGKTAEADAIRRALEQLYRDDPDPAVHELLQKES